MVTNHDDSGLYRHPTTTRGFTETVNWDLKDPKSHVDNIDFFAEYLVYYEPLQRLDEADDGDVSSFLMDWFPRKALWASVSSTKSYLASFKKFFQWMGETKRIPAEVVNDVLTMLKEDKQDFIDAGEDDDSW